MNKLMKAGAAALVLATSATAITPAYAQYERGGHERGGHERGDRGDRGGRGDHDRGGDRGGRGGWDRGDRDHDRGDRGHRGGHGDHIIGGIVGGVIGGLLHGETRGYRFSYDHDYYGRRGYGHDYYNRWSNRDRGYGCDILGYRRGCRTIYYSHNFIILNLRGDVYCYRREYRRWHNTYCPRDWYRY